MSGESSKNQTIERLTFIFLPLIIAFIDVLLFKKNLSIELVKKIDGQEIYQTMLSLWGTLLGFIFATAAILISVNDTEFIRQLRASGNYRSVLIAYISSCMHLFVGIVITSFLYLFDKWGWACMAFLVVANIDIFITVGITIFFFAKMIIREK